MNGLIFVALVIIGIAAVAAAISKSKKTNEAWAAAASRLQLVFQPGQVFSRPRISGIHRGCSVLVTTFSKGSGKSQTTYTRFRASYPHRLELGLRLTRQGLLSGLGKLLGAQDIEVGEEGFDDAVVVKGRDPQRVKAFLTPSRRMRAARFLTTYQGSVIDDSGVEWERRYVERDPDKIVRVLQRMTSLASHMMDERADDAAVDEAIAARLEGRLDEALEVIHQVPDEHEADALDLHVFEGEILLATGKSEAAAETFTKVHNAQPEDSEVLKLAEQASKQPAPAEPSVGAADDLDVGPVCERLFDPKNMTSDTNELFEKHYRGGRVRWSGTLTSVRSYTFDLVFGNEPGSRAVFEIHKMGGPSFSARPVQAVVQFPADKEAFLRSKLDKPLSFEGKLVSCDAFMRNLFVAEGQLV
jgi:hypothetical protein